MQFLLQLEESNKYKNSFKDSREMKKQQVMDELAFPLQLAEDGQAFSFLETFASSRFM